MKNNSRIIGMGVDLTSISRMHKLLMKYGEKFVKRIYHPIEIDQCPYSFESAFHRSNTSIGTLNMNTTNNNSPDNDDHHVSKREINTRDQEFNQHLLTQQHMVLQMKIAQYYASRWAAKEATIKALGVSGIGSKQMYVHKQQQTGHLLSETSKISNNYRTRLFPPLLKLEGEEISKIVREILDERNANDYVTHLSLSHEGDMAIANVIIEAIYE
nr:unnamed protein product [Naegleria fowleri]